MIECPNCENDSRLKTWKFEGFTFVECPECTKVSELPEPKETVQ